MARDGYRIFDSDTHVGPDAAILDRYLSRAERDRLAGWEEYRSTARNGHVTYTKGQRRYRRKLGTAEPDETPAGYMAGFTGVARERCGQADHRQAVADRVVERRWLARSGYGRSNVGCDVNASVSEIATVPAPSSPVRTHAARLAPAIAPAAMSANGGASCKK